MVGARGFEPPTPCAQASEQKYISLVRIAFLCVIEHGFIRYLSAFGPKLDPSFDPSRPPEEFPAVYYRPGPLQRLAGVSQGALADGFSFTVTCPGGVRSSTRG